MQTIPLKIIAGFVLGVALLVGAAWLSQRNVDIVRSSSGQLQSTQSAINKLNLLTVAVGDVETGQRGFVIVGDENYLEPYHRGLVDSAQALRQLDRLMASNPTERSAITELAAQVAQRLALARAQVEQHRLHPLAGAEIASTAAQGKLATDRVRASIATLMQQQQRLLVERTARMQDQQAQSRIIVLAVTGLSIALMLVALFFILRDFSARVRAQKALRDSEAHLRTIFESLNQVIWTCDAGARCDYLSPRWTAFTGTPAQDALGLAWLEQVHPDDRAAMQDSWLVALKSAGPFDVDCRLRARDGHYRWFRNHAVALSDDNGRVVQWFGSSTDIDEEMRSRQDLLDRDRMLRRAEHIARLGYFVEDPATGNATISESAAHLLGLEKGGRPILTLEQRSGLLHPADRERWESWLDQGASAVPTRRLQRIVRSDGEVRYLEIHMDVDSTDSGIPTFGVLQDVTEARLAERAFRNTEKRLRMALQAAGLGEWDLDLRTRMVRRDARHDQIYGLEDQDDECLVDHFVDRIDPQDRELTLRALRASVSAGTDWQQEVRIIRADGARRWIWIVGSNYADDDGQVLGIVGTILDITDRKNAEEQLRRHANQQAVVAALGLQALSGQPLADVLERACRDAAKTLDADCSEITLADTSGDIVDAPARTGFGWLAAADAFSGGSVGVHARYVLDQDGPLLLNSDAGNALLRSDAALVAQGIQSSASVIIRGKSGRHGIVSVYSRDSHAFQSGDTDFLQGIANILSAAIERASGETELAFLAHHDLLTRLPNRKLMNDRLAMAIAHARRNELLLALLFIDLDRFKLVNDSLGHQVGDRLLQQVAQRIRACTHDDDTVSRQGGDEYTVLLPDAQRIERVASVARHILDELAQPFRIDGRDIFVSASIGIALYPDDAADVHELARQADAAMYRAKERGRNGYQFFTQEINATMQRRLELENGLRNALPRGELRLVYQPQLDPLSHEVTAFEALLRWTHPELGDVNPNTFIPIAEDTGLIVPIGEWVLREACRAALRWQQSGHSNVRLAVNLSARQFFEKDIAERIRAISHETGMDPRGLEFEITESDIMRDVEGVVEHIHQIKRMGASVAIDDFGTGYSSLSYLQRFDVDVLKIDRSFVRDIATDRDDAAIAASVIALAHSLDMTVVAEGVENVAQRDFLVGCGCDLVQGYLYARPMEEAAIADYLAQVARRVPTTQDVGAVVQTP